LRYIDPDGHQTTTADNIKQRVTDFVIGVGRGISSSLTFGASGAPRPDDSLTNRAGQGLGTVATSVGGVLLFKIGAGSDVLSGSALTKVSVVAVTTGVVTVAGATTNAVNIAATPMQRIVLPMTHPMSHKTNERMILKTSRANRLEGLVGEISQRIDLSKEPRII